MFNTHYIQRIVQHPGCLGIVIFATFISGGVIALLGYSLVVTSFPELRATATPSGCQIELTVAHELYDTPEDYWNDQLPIGDVESGIYEVVASSSELVAINWRGEGNLQATSPETLDWVYPKESVNRVFGDCLRISRFASVAPELTTAPD